MATIHHFELEITDYQEISLPSAHQLLSVAPSRYEIGQKIDLWALVKESHHNVLRPIVIVGTGNPIPDLFPLVGSFLGTAVMRNGLVWHVFFGHQKELGT